MTEQLTESSVSANTANDTADGARVISDDVEASADSGSDGTASLADTSSSTAASAASTVANVHVQQLNKTRESSKSSSQQSDDYLHANRNNKKSSEAKRTPSNVSGKSVTFCLKYIYSWYPTSVDIDLVESYFESIPEDKIPKIGTVGEKYREIQLFRQIPPQDLIVDNCLFLQRQHYHAFQSMVQERNERALDVANVVYVYDTNGTCTECGQRFHKITSEMKDNQEKTESETVEKSHEESTREISSSKETDTLPVAVSASLEHVDEVEVFKPQEEGESDSVKYRYRVNQSHNLDGNLWHPSCFVCSVCKELLVDLIYCRKEGSLYCLRHYSETIWPRCPACDELVLDESRTKAMDSEWHEKHFSCWQCDENLTAKKYVLRDDKSYCIKCFESNFSSTCDACKKIIGIDSKDLAYKEKHWHEACFLCTQCSISLVDKNFGSKSDKLYCSNCYDIQFSTKCEGCGDIFRSGSKKVEYKGQVFHDQCFLCVGCKIPIGSKSFVPKGTETYCTDCYEEKFANRCIKCNKTITGNGLSFRDDNWHKECFTCLNCNTQLFGTKFTTKNDKPYCAECFGNLFAKKCTRCTKGIIPGGSGSRFISFEDRNWHNDCFVCSGCSTSLIGKGFIADGPDILCSECARQRLA